MCSCSKSNIPNTESCKCHDAGLCQNPSNFTDEKEEENKDEEGVREENSENEN